MRLHAKEMGNTLSEYGLIAAAIAIVGVAGTLLLGGGLSEIVQKVTSEQAKHASNAETVAVAAVTASEALQSANAARGEGEPAVITLSDGTQLTLSNLPGNVPQAVQTTGGNGATMMLANSLEDIATQLLQQGKITETQADSIYKIAKQGHKLAEIEGLIETATARCTSSSCFNQQSIAYGGIEYPDPAKLANLIGYKPNFGNGPELSTLYKLLDGAKASGALADPTVNALVTQLTNQMGNVADSLESATGPVADGSSSPKEILKIAASYTTDETADTLCKMRGSSGKCK